MSSPQPPKQAGSQPSSKQLLQRMKGTVPPCRELTPTSRAKEPPKTNQVLC